MTNLTAAVRDRAAAALQRAHDEGRPKAHGQPWLGDAVCACVIIAEEFGRPEADPRRRDDASHDRLYGAVEGLGFQPGGVIHHNDRYIGRTFHRSRRATFADVAEWVAGLAVIDEAEAILHEAALVSA